MPTVSTPPGSNHRYSVTALAATGLRLTGGANSASADDNDGDLDLIVAAERGGCCGSSQDSLNMLFVNDGDSTFTPKMDTPLSTMPTWSGWALWLDGLYWVDINR